MMVSHIFMSILGNVSYGLNVFEGKVKSIDISIYSHNKIFTNLRLSGCVWTAETSFNILLQDFRHLIRPL